MKKDSKKIKVALIQQSYVFDELKKILKNKTIESKKLQNSQGLSLESWQFELSEKMKEKTKKCIKKAAKNADLVLLQELHTMQYFCQSENTKYFEFARDFESNIKFFSKIARECGVVMVTSLFEERAAGLYHNTAVVFERDGKIAGKYRKMHIPDDPQFYEKFYFTPGDLGFRPIETSVGRLGVLICWDQWFPEAARLMSMAGADLLIFPTAIGWFDADSTLEKTRQLEAWQTIQRSHAVANGIPVASINRVGFEPNLDSINIADFVESSCLDSIESKSQDSKDSKGAKNADIQGIRFFGNSFICGAQGEILAQASSDKDEIIYAEIDKNRTKEVRDIWPFLRDRRIDFYAPLTKRHLSE